MGVDCIGFSRATQTSVGTFDDCLDRRICPHSVDTIRPEQ